VLQSFHPCPSGQAGLLGSYPEQISETVKNTELLKAVCSNAEKRIINTVCIVLYETIIRPSPSCPSGQAGFQDF
jgi:hypothetical protein